MKEKHVQARIKICRAIAECSPCVCRKDAALLYDPVANVDLMSGYSGSPRGGGPLCGGVFCRRVGPPTDPGAYKVGPRWDSGHRRTGFTSWDQLTVTTEHGLQEIAAWSHYEPALGNETPEERGKKELHRFMVENDPMLATDRVEIGCHHAEMNVICNAAAHGVRTAGMHLVSTTKPCLMCAKLIHHAGIRNVTAISTGSNVASPDDEGVKYLKAHDIAFVWIH